MLWVKSVKYRSSKYPNQISILRVFHHVGMWFSQEHLDEKEARPLARMDADKYYVTGESCVVPRKGKVASGNHPSLPGSVFGSWEPPECSWERFWLRGTALAFLGTPRVPGNATGSWENQGIPRIRFSVSDRPQNYVGSGEA